MPEQDLPHSASQPPDLSPDLSIAHHSGRENFGTENISARRNARDDFHHGHHAAGRAAQNGFGTRTTPAGRPAGAHDIPAGAHDIPAGGRDIEDLARRLRREPGAPAATANGPAPAYARPAPSSHAARVSSDPLPVQAPSDALPVTPPVNTTNLAHPHFDYHADPSNSKIPPADITADNTLDNNTDHNINDRTPIDPVAPETHDRKDHSIRSADYADQLRHDQYRRDLDNAAGPPVAGLQIPATSGGGDEPGLSMASERQRIDTPPSETPRPRRFRGYHIFLNAHHLPRLGALAGLGVVLILVIGFFIIAKAREAGLDRQNEASLILRMAVIEAADLVETNRETALVENRAVSVPAIRGILKRITPSRFVALYDVAADRQSLLPSPGDIHYNLTPQSMTGLDFSAPGTARIDGTRVGSEKIKHVIMAWRPMSNGRVIVGLAPFRDIYGRLPASLSYALFACALLLTFGCLLFAIFRQSYAVKAAATALDTQQSNSEALGNTGAGVWRYDPHENNVILPGPAMAALGFRPEETGYPIRELTALVHPHDVRAVLKLFTGNMQKQSDLNIRLRNFQNEWQAALLRGEDSANGGVVSGLIIVFSDEQRDLHRAVEAENRLIEAIESIPEAFLLWDQRERLIAWNKRFCNIFRIAPDRLRAGMSVSEVINLAGDAEETLSRHFTPIAQGAEKTEEVPLPSERWGYVSRRSTADGGCVCVATNVTHIKHRAKAQKRKERELELMIQSLKDSRAELHEAVERYEIEKKRAEQASHSKSEFLANMSHELRTPLNAINGFSEVMLSELYGELGHPKYKEYVRDILESGHHLLTLIDDILDMSKIEAGRMEISIGSTDIERLLGEGLRFIEPLARQKSILVNTAISNLPAVWGDARAIKQIFLNLLSNAVKFTAGGGSISVTAQVDLDTVTVMIADTGTGMSEETMKHLGKPFELTEDHFAKSRRGSGLGIALSKSLLELQGGMLAIASTAEKGTVASFVLPRRADAEVTLPELLRNRARIITQIPLQPATRLSDAGPGAMEQSRKSGQAT